MQVARPHRPWYLAIAAGIAYGVLIRLSLWRDGAAHRFVAPLDRWVPSTLWVMTAGFIFLLPFAIGWLTIIAFRDVNDERRWSCWIFAPWLAVLLANAAVFAIGLEGAICVVLALPVQVVFSSLGGVTAGLLQRRRFLRSRGFTLCLAMTPLLLAGLEANLDEPLAIRTVETSTIIHAPADVVWRNVASVPAIRHDELTPNWTHRIGFPLPVAATLSHPGIGGVRNASFEGGLLFRETVTDWQPNQRIHFTIKADTTHIPPTTLDEHVTIGGRFFDVLNGEYWLEPHPDGTILLHLSSQERLSTDFNAYAALWTDAIMRSLQNSILEVVQHRCEREAHSESRLLSAGNRGN